MAARDAQKQAQRKKGYSSTILAGPDTANSGQNAPTWGGKTLLGS